MCIEASDYHHQTLISNNMERVSQTNKKMWWYNCYISIMYISSISGVAKDRRQSAPPAPQTNTEILGTRWKMLKKIERRNERGGREDKLTELEELGTAGPHE